MSNGGDAAHYWEYPSKLNFNSLLDLTAANFGNGFIYLFNFLPANILDLDFFTGNVIYGTFGYIGFIYLYTLCLALFNDNKLLRSIKYGGISLFPLIWFLPNFHFWSAGIGKDTLIFSCVVIFLHSLMNPRKKIVQIGLTSLVCFVIRPHILFFLMIALAVSLLLDVQLKKGQKFILLVISAGLVIIIFDNVLNFVRIENVELNAISEYAINKSSNLNQLNSESGIDISNYSYPYKVFTFLYRPFFYDIKGTSFLFSSIENLVLLIFTLLLFFKKPFKAFLQSHYIVKTGLVFFIIGSMSFSLILGNLGIMLRQKNMLVPWLIVYGLWVFYAYNQSMVPNNVSGLGQIQE